jgi:hypothetical protein
MQAKALVEAVTALSFICKPLIRMAKTLHENLAIRRSATKGAGFGLMKASSPQSCPQVRWTSKPGDKVVDSGPPQPDFCASQGWLWRAANACKPCRFWAVRHQP